MRHVNLALGHVGEDVPLGLLSTWTILTTSFWRALAFLEQVLEHIKLVKHLKQIALQVLFQVIYKRECDGFSTMLYDIEIRVKEQLCREY